MFLSKIVLVLILSVAGESLTKGLHFDLKKHPETRRRRLFYEGVGTRKEDDGVYYATLRIGTPNPQDFTVIIDTGSATIAIPCKGCSCGDHNHFDSAISESDTNTGRSYSQCYAEGSCNRGSYFNDKMCLGGSCSEDEMITHDFGCCSSFASSFKAQKADGIVGLGGVSNSFISALRAKQNLLDDNEFSLCLGSSSGHLNIGGYDETVNLEPIQWIDHTSLTGYYHLNFENIVIDAGAENSASVNIGKSALIDSGTSFSYIPYSIHNSVKNKFSAWCSEVSNRCLGTHNPSSAYSMDIRDSIACYSPPSGTSPHDQNWLDTFPTLELKISNHDAYVCVPPEQYFFISKSDAMCVGLFKDSQFVIGANFMVDFQYIYDSDHSRIGIARARCDGSPKCCGKCKERTTPTAPFNWCVSDWEPKTCAETCMEEPYTLSRNIVGCKSSNGFLVNDSSCLDSGSRPDSVYECMDACEDNSNNTTTTATTTTYEPCPDNHTTTGSYGEDTKGEYETSTSFIVATVLLVAVIVSAGLLLIFGSKLVKRSETSRPVNDSWIAVRSADPDNDCDDDNDDGDDNDDDDGDEVPL